MVDDLLQTLDLFSGDIQLFVGRRGRISLRLLQTAVHRVPTVHLLLDALELIGLFLEEMLQFIRSSALFSYESLMLRDLFDKLRRR